MTTKWHTGKYPGVRWRLHPERKHGVQYDRYYVVRYKRDGVLKSESLGWSSEGMSESEASRILGELQKNYRLGEGEASLREKRQKAELERKEKAEVEERKQRDNLTFEVLFKDKYLPQNKGNKKDYSLKKEDELFRLWIQPTIGKLRLNEVSPFSLEKIKKNLADKGRSAKTIHYVLSVVRQVFNYAIRNDLFSGVNPVSRVKMPKVDNQRKNFFTKEEAEVILAALKKRSQQCHDMTLLSFHTGMRFSEIAGLTWGDVDIEAGTILIRDTKSGKDRYAIMTDRVKDMLCAHGVGKREDLIFPARGGGRMVAISDVFDRTIRGLGFNEGVVDRRQRLCFHSCRHSFASWLALLDVDLFRIAKLMGHSTIKMTERYSHLRPSALKSDVAKLNDELNKIEVPMDEEKQSNAKIIPFAKK